MSKTLAQNMAEICRTMNGTRSMLAAEILAELDGLAELRRLAELTQAQVAEALHVKQPTVHEIEKRADLYLSTLGALSRQPAECLSCACPCRARECSS